MERQILDSQERAFWNVHRPPVRNNNRPFPIYSNSNMAPVLEGIKQKKLIIHPSTSM